MMAQHDVGKQIRSKRDRTLQAAGKAVFRSSVFSILLIFLFSIGIMAGDHTGRVSISRIVSGKRDLTLTVQKRENEAVRAAYRQKAEKKWHYLRTKDSVCRITGLKAGTVYEVKVQSCAGTAAGTVYGPWCKTASKKTLLHSLADLSGRWKCEREICRDVWQVGYLELEIRKNGRFHSVDVGAGNPGIKGKMKILSDRKIRIDCSGDPDFDPYWKDLKQKDTVYFRLLSERELRVYHRTGKNRSTLVFKRLKRFR